MPSEKRSKRQWWIYLGGGTLWISILIHVLFGTIAAYIIVEHFSKQHVSFTATPPPAPANEVEHKVEVAKKNNIESAPPDLKRITTTDVSPISLPDVPQIPVTDETTPAPMAGTGDIGEGMGAGNGNGGGDGGGMPAFGSSDGRGLEGYFYDLKQTRDRKPTGVRLGEFYKILKLYLDHQWDDEDLKKYFRSDRPLYATRFAISTRKSAEAPKAFHLENEVKPALWAIHYKGKVTAPEGDYRFVGFADNVIVVRIGGEVVFDGGWTTLVTKNDLHVNYPFGWSPFFVSRGSEKAARGLLKHGIQFHIEGGQPVDMDVLIGDDGGECAFYLMVMREGNTYDSLPDGTPKAPFFQLDSNGPQQFLPNEEHPPYSTTPEPWQALDQ